MSSPKKSPTPTELSLAEAMDFVEDHNESRKLIPAEQAFWRRLKELPETAHEERGTIYYYLLRTLLKPSRLFENEKAQNIYEKMRDAFRDQDRLYRSRLRQNSSDRLLRLQYDAFLKITERYFFSLEVIYRKKNWQKALRHAYTEKMRYRQLRFWFERHYLDWLFYKFLELSSHYGESFLRWGLTTVIFILVYGLLYAGIDLLQTGGAMQASSGFFDYFYFSVVTFSSLGYGDITPITDLEKILIGIEVICGFLMLGSFMALLQRKLR